MKVELQQLKGIKYNGDLEEFERWQVFATGANGNRVLVGYLDPVEEPRLMLLTKQPPAVLRELLSKCAAIAKRNVLPPHDIVLPPEMEIDNSEGYDEEDDQDD